MYMTINDIIGEKRIDLSYPIRSGREALEGPRLPLNPAWWSAEITVVSMLNDNVSVPVTETSFSHGSYFRHKKDDSK